MSHHRHTIAALSVMVLLPLTAIGASAGAATDHDLRDATTMGCTPGSHTLSQPGDHVYPETGNGGYTSVHTDIHLVYDAPSDQFLPGSYVDLRDVATQCLSSFSLDFEPNSRDTVAGPDLVVGAVSVNGRPAQFSFVQPTYPGDPHGQDDPNPAAHEASQLDPVGGPADNGLPPACSPELTDTDSTQRNSQNGEQCPADKLVIVPRRPIRSGVTFKVTVAYTGRPGVHTDGDGETEGWFRSSSGGFVTTEPVGTEAWMPVNDAPSAKPTYETYDRVNAGRTAIANGELVSTTSVAPDAEFPHGSVLYHWKETAPVASYLVENSVGDYSLSERTGADGIRYYVAQDRSISVVQQHRNLAVIDRQQDITDFEATFNGPYPFTSDGVVVGTPDASFEEEMETMITFAGGTVGRRTLYHENMHQWWGDNVTESTYSMTFFKEGLATFAQFLDLARAAELAAGGPGSTAGQAAFERSLTAEFDHIYASNGKFWTLAPSDPTPFTLFDVSSTYQRPAAAYVALRAILGPAAFSAALQQLQRTYGGGSINEPALESVFRQFLPDRSAGCSARLATFFAQWFDTPYPRGGGAVRPQITGPGLDGPNFYAPSDGCV